MIRLDVKACASDLHFYLLSMENSPLPAIDLDMDFFTAFCLRQPCMTMNLLTATSTPTNKALRSTEEEGSDSYKKLHIDRGDSMRKNVVFSKILTFLVAVG